MNTNDLIPTIAKIKKPAKSRYMKPDSVKQLEEDISIGNTGIALYLNIADLRPHFGTIQPILWLNV